MSKAALDKRLDALQARVAPRLAPPELPDWLRWATFEELDALEAAFRTFALCDEGGWLYPPELVERVETITAEVVERMQSGTPDDETRHRLELEADVLEQRRRGRAGWLGYDARTDPLCEVPVIPGDDGPPRLRVVRSG